MLVPCSVTTSLCDTYCCTMFALITLSSTYKALNSSALHVLDTKTITITITSCWLCGGLSGTELPSQVRGQSLCSGLA